MPAEKPAHIVLIEPDGAMRALLQEWLAGAGHRVQARAHAGVAGESDVNLVVLDLRDLPTLGADTVNRVRKMFPAAGVLGLTTQATRAASPRLLQALAPGLAALLPKPCTRGELLAAVDEVLAGEHAPDAAVPACRGAAR